jgi:hypothetical protein
MYVHTVGGGLITLFRNSKCNPLQLLNTGYIWQNSKLTFFVSNFLSVSIKKYLVGYVRTKAQNNLIFIDDRD